MENVKSKSFFLIFFLLIIILPIMFSACSSTDVKNNDTKAYISGDYEYEYRAINDETIIKYKLIIDNQTIYNMKSQTITFDLYSESEYLRTETVNYDFFITNSTNGVEKSTYFITSGNIDEIKGVSFTCTYYSFWDTYKLYIIITAIISIILAVLYIIFMIVCDLDLDDVLEYAWVLVFALVFFAPYIVSGFATASWGWVAPLIILAGIGIAVGISAIAQAIKEAVD